MSETFPSLPAVSRGLVGREDLPYFETLKKLVDCLSWERVESQPNPILSYGNFGGGSTIQVGACEGSYYHSPDMVPLREITACAAPENYTMLLETGGKRGSYLTLSHRWGERPKTEPTKDNFDRFKQALPMDELPPTFKDAITATRQLGLQYIWIDSLCIIQHDKEDWVHESAKMGDIFESSSCTLAAVDALDDDSNDQGLFLPRSNPLAVRICCPVTPVKKYEWLKNDQGGANISDTLRHNTITLRP
ncbi:heterokaryon incompatibility protein [Rutstroemia sp. NJR-2017a BBW]|nr:heterokaryon incompatibility protein [Rutstroemia sp. NJR-2017a BBW]